MAATTATKTKRRTLFNASPLGIGFAVLLVIVLVGYFILRPQQATAVYASTLRQSTPLILGALCGLIGERSGIINIGIEGQMLMAAFIAFSYSACASARIWYSGEMPVTTRFSSSPPQPTANGKESRMAAKQRKNAFRFMGRAGGVHRMAYRKG